MAASAKVPPAYTPAMRLSLSTRSTIRDTVRSVVGPDATVRLFGSRTDDDARGGDIDLLDGLLDVEDVDLIAGIEDEGFHLRIPAFGLVTEVDTSFDEFGEDLGHVVS